MSLINVLVTSAGGASAVNVIEALRAQGQLPVRLVAVDMEPTAAGLFLADAGYTIPGARDPSFIPTLLDICEREAIGVILPILSVEMPILAAHSDEFARRGIRMTVSSPETIALCNDKRSTARFFGEHGIPAPRTWAADALPSSWGELPFPLIVKPSVGSGSRHTYRVDSAAQLGGILPIVPDPIVQELVQGPEYTVDLMADRQSKLLAAVPRERMRTSGGKAILARTVNDREMLGWVEQIVSEVRLIGPGNIQCIRGDGGLQFIEINARFAAGGLPLAVEAGANIPLMAIKQALGLPVPRVGEYAEGLIMVRHFTQLFLQDESMRRYLKLRRPA